MQKAKDVMQKVVVTISPDATLEEACNVLISKQISGMPVVDAKGKLVGLLSEKDILNFVFSGNLKNTKVSEAMSKDLTIFPPDADADKIALAIGEKKIRRVPIVDSNGKVVGIVSRRDIIRIAIEG